MSRASTTALLTVLLASLAASGLPVRAQDEPPPAAAPDADAPAAASRDAGDDSDASGADDEQPLGAAEERAAGDDLDEFVPSEEIPPDEQVTFPADI